MKKIISILLVAVLFLGAAFSLSSCNSELSEVNALVLEYYKEKNIDYSNGYKFTYEVVYNYEKDTKLPSKYYKVHLGAGTNSITMYKGMFDK